MTVFLHIVQRGDYHLVSFPYPAHICLHPQPSGLGVSHVCLWIRQLYRLYPVPVGIVVVRFRRCHSGTDVCLSSPTQ
jgi:hypothetical protein